MTFVEKVYLYTGSLPESEKYGLTQQMRRAAVSIPSNIAEGYGRSTPTDFARFVDIALGSIREAQTQLEICDRIGLCSSGEMIQTNHELIASAEEIARILFGLSKSLRAKTT